MPKDNPKFQACVAEKVEGGMNQGTAEAMCERELIEAGEYYEEGDEGRRSEVAQAASEAREGGTGNSPKKQY